MAGNGFAALVKQRSSGKTKRRRLDDYETPPSDTQILLDNAVFAGPILEPACGSGRMTRVLADAGFKVKGSDIKQGDDFLERTRIWRGDIITNPPYRDGLAEAFVRHALKLANGKVAMLLQSGFLWGEKRASGLFAETRPAQIIVVPHRIYFFEGKRQITSQFYSHAWLVWPERELRDEGNYDTLIFWDAASGF